MGKEIELAYYNVDREDLLKKLNKLGAKFLGKYRMKRANFQVATRGSPGSKRYYTSWVRVRSNGTSTTLTLKEQKGNSIAGRREYEVDVNNFEEIVRMLSKILPNSPIDYFENEREEYELNGIRFTIDKFPGMPYLLEIEGRTKKEVERISKQLDVHSEIDKNKSVPTAVYYKMHGLDYSKIQKAYRRKLQSMIK